MSVVQSKLAFGAALVAVMVASFVAVQLVLPGPSASSTTEADPSIFASHDFGRGAEGERAILRNGWLDARTDCRWSGGRAELALPKVFTPAQAVEMRVNSRGLVSASRPSQSVNFIVNGSLVGKLQFKSEANGRVQTFKISPAVYNAAKGPLRIAFVEPTPASFADVGSGSDTRKRSICLDRLSMSLAAS
ncbi:MAG: hypothetical protein AAFZ01_05080 [Pseudomonadota bacterium]